MTRHHSIRALTLVLGLGLGLAATTVASAQTVGYNVRTGDVWVDSRLGEINDYGRHHRDPFINEMTGYYGAPRPLLVDLLDRRGWAPGDVYYACAIAHALGRPCVEVVREYDRNPGQGWGALAKRMGIKPGSPAFHALKRGQVDTYGRWGHPIEIDRPVRVDWSQPGHGRGNSAGRGDSQGKGHQDNRGNKGNKGNRGNRGNGQGNKGRGNGNGQR